MIKIFLAGFMSLAVTSANAEEAKLCIGAVEANPQILSGARTTNYSIQIDNGKKITPSTVHSTSYSPLDAETKHIAKIYYEGNIDQSFYFEFTSNEMCLWYEPLYYTWSLWEQKRSKHLCHCK